MPRNIGGPDPEPHRTVRSRGVGWFSRGSILRYRFDWVVGVGVLMKVENEAGERIYGHLPISLDRSGDLVGYGVAGKLTSRPMKNFFSACSA